jgi:hypothetical protein
VLHVPDFEAKLNGKHWEVMELRESHTRGGRTAVVGRSRCHCGVLVVVDDGLWRIFPEVRSKFSRRVVGVTVVTRKSEFILFYY